MISIKNQTEIFAWIYSPSVFSKLAAKRSAGIAVGKVVTRFFTDAALAAGWLENL